MAAEKINPKSLYDPTPFGFSHASRQTSGHVLHVAGQVAWDKDLKVVGSDLATQARCALANLKTILADAGAGPADILRMRTYVVNHDPSKLGPVTEEIMAFYAGATPAPNTWIGVQALALPDFLIEIEVTAQVAE
ncbi:MAG: RidA family protein [Rhodospirillaceae bacterium]